MATKIIPGAIYLLQIGEDSGFVTRIATAAEPQELANAEGQTVTVRNHMSDARIATFRPTMPRNDYFAGL